MSLVSEHLICQSKLTGLAEQRSEVSIEREIWIHDDTKIRKFNLDVSDMDSWSGRKHKKPLMCTKEYTFGFIWIEGKAVEAEQWVQISSPVQSPQR